VERKEEGQASLFASPHRSPNPLTHTELAARAGVSKPAVTKAKETLRDVCDLRELTYDRFVLRDDAAGAGIVAQTYYNNGGITRFLGSRYVVFLVKKLGIHEELAKSWPAYGLVFDKADTDLMIEYVMSNLTFLEDIRLAAKKLGSPAFYLQVHGLERLEPAFKRVRLPIEDESSLNEFLILRDKWFALLNQELSKTASTLSIMQKLSPRERETYARVYSQTIEYYLRQVFQMFSEDLAKSIDSAIRLPPQYGEIGSFYVIAEGTAMKRPRPEGKVVGVRVPSR
jgi:hypothetical protein